MAIEMTMLGWSVILGLVQIGLVAMFSVAQRGLGWAVGARDVTPAPLTGIGGRLDRATRNFLETFPLFAAVALAVVFVQHGDAISALGAQLYFWARLVYVPVYAAGIPYLRTLVWLVSIVGIILLLVAML